MHTPRKTAAHRTALLAGALVTSSLIITGCSSSPGGDASTATSSAAAAPSGSNNELGQPFKSTDGYTISPPAGWVYHPTGGQQGISSVFAATTRDTAAKAPFADNVNVVITPAQANLNDTIAQTKQQYPSVLTNYKVVTDQPTTVAGQPAYLLGGTYDDDKAGPLQNLQLILIAGNKSYTITFTSSAPTFAGQRAVAEASLRSFQLG